MFFLRMVIILLLVFLLSAKHLMAGDGSISYKITQNNNLAGKISRDISSTVNPQTAVTYGIPIIEDLMTLSYSNVSVPSVASTRNQDIQTSWVGLGWSLGLDVIYVNHKGSIERFDDDYVLMSRGEVTKIVKDGSFPLSNDLYAHTEFSISSNQVIGIIITRKDGTKYYYGDFTNHADINSANANLYTPYWGTRIINSHFDSIPTGFFPFAFRLQKIELPNGRIIAIVNYENKINNYYKKIYEYSKASYIAEIVLPQKMKKFKFVLENRPEEPDPDYCYPENRTRIEMRELMRLQRVDVYGIGESGEKLLESLHLNYEMLNTIGGDKALLSSVIPVSATGMANIGWSFDYQNVETSPLLEKIVTPDGASLQYDYELTEYSVEGGNDSGDFKDPSGNVYDNTGMRTIASSGGNTIAFYDDEEKKLYMAKWESGNWYRDNSGALNINTMGPYSDNAHSRNKPSVHVADNHVLFTYRYGGGQNATVHALFFFFDHKTMEWEKVSEFDLTDLYGERYDFIQSVISSDGTRAGLYIAESQGKQWHPYIIYLTWNELLESWEIFADFAENLRTNTNNDDDWTNFDGVQILNNMLMYDNNDGPYLYEFYNDAQGNPQARRIWHVYDEENSDHRSYYSLRQNFVGKTLKDNGRFRVGYFPIVTNGDQIAVDNYVEIGNYQHGSSFLNMQTWWSQAFFTDNRVIIKEIANDLSFQKVYYSYVEEDGFKYRDETGHQPPPEIYSIISDETEDWYIQPQINDDWISLFQYRNSDFNPGWISENTKLAKIKIWKWNKSASQYETNDNNEFEYTSDDHDPVFWSANSVLYQDKIIITTKGTQVNSYNEAGFTDMFPLDVTASSKWLGDQENILNGTPVYSGMNQWWMNQLLIGRNFICIYGPNSNYIRSRTFHQGIDFSRQPKSWQLQREEVTDGSSTYITSYEYSWTPQVNESNMTSSLMSIDQSGGAPIFKHIKISTSGKGYVKKYFHFNINSTVDEYKKRGLLKKVEKYNADGELYFTRTNSYDFYIDPDFNHLEFLRLGSKTDERNGIEYTKQFDYNNDNGQIKETIESWTGLSESLSTQIHYAFEITDRDFSEGMKSSNMLSQIAQKTVLSPSYSSAERTSFQSEHPHFAFQSATWRPQDKEEYNFADDQFIVTSDILSFNDVGSVVESKDAYGTITSRQYTCDGLLVEAEVGNAQAGEIAYESFDSAPFLWLNSGAESAGWQWKSEIEARSGLTSLAMRSYPQQAPYHYALNRTFAATDLNLNSAYIFSAWVKAPETHDHIEIQLKYTTVSGEHYPPAAVYSRSGEWQLLQVELDLDQCTGVTEVNAIIRNYGANGIVCHVDDIRFYPADAKMRTMVYDKHDFKLLAEEDDMRQSIHYHYNGRGNAIGSSDGYGRLLGTSGYYQSRQGNDGQYSPDDPNYTYKVTGIEGGYLEDFSSESVPENQYIVNVTDEDVEIEVNLSEDGKLTWEIHAMLGDGLFGLREKASGTILLEVDRTAFREGLVKGVITLAAGNYVIFGDLGGFGELYADVRTYTPNYSSLIENWEIDKNEHTNILWTVADGSLQSSVLNGSGYSYLKCSNEDIAGKPLYLEYDVKFCNDASYGGILYRGVYINVNPTQLGWDDPDTDFISSDFKSDQWHNVQIIVFPGERSIGDDFITLIVDGKTLISKERLDLGYSSDYVGIVSNYYRGTMQVDNFRYLINPVIETTFVDGFGREFQTQIIKPRVLDTYDATNGMHELIVSGVGFDAGGRANRKYLPLRRYHTQVEDIFSYYSAYIADLEIEYTDAAGRFYSETLFSARADERIEATYRVGDSNPMITFVYGVSSSVIDGYNPGELFRVESIDYGQDMHHPVRNVVYLNAMGHEVYKITDADGQAITSAYEYDMAGQLLRKKNYVERNNQDCDIIDPADGQFFAESPDGNEVYIRGNSITLTSGFHTRPGQKLYIGPHITIPDDLQQTKEITQISAYTYNTLGLLTGENLPDQEAIAYLYDKSGRMVMKQDGEAALRNKMLYYRYDDFGRLADISEGSIDYFQQYYADDGVNSTNTTQLVRYYYDGYSAHADAENTRGQLVRRSFRIGTGEHWNDIYYSYDEKHRLAWMHYAIGPASDKMIEKRIYYEYDEHDRLVKKIYNPDGADCLYYWYEYDAQGNLQRLYTHTSDNRRSANPEAEYGERDVFGNLLRLTLGGDVQTLDYSYHRLYGWLTDINNVDELGDDKFAQRIYRENAGHGGSHTHRNGLINSSEFRYTSLSGPTVEHHLTHYTYDNLGQISAASFYAISGDNYTLDEDKSLQEVNYDDLGNILFLKRARREYLYSYDDNNQLLGTDGARARFGYNANGNLASDSERSLDAVTYNFQDLATEMQFAGHTVTYGYTDDGQRLFKTLDGDVVTYYIYDISGNLLAEYEGDGDIKTWRLGSIGFKAPYYQGTMSYYYLKDHIGNVRMTVSEAHRVVGKDDYFPFGLQIAGLSYSGGSANAYKFSGKELEEEGGFLKYHFGWRDYDPELGRWFAIDPARQFESPYVFTANNPVYLYDEDGRYVEWLMLLYTVYTTIDGGLKNGLPGAAQGFFRGAYTSMAFYGGYVAASAFASSFAGTVGFGELMTTIAQTGDLIYAVPYITSASRFAFANYVIGNIPSDDFSIHIGDLSINPLLLAGSDVNMLGVSASLTLRSGNWSINLGGSVFDGKQFFTNLNGIEYRASILLAWSDSRYSLSGGTNSFWTDKTPQTLSSIGFGHADWKMRIENDVIGDGGDRWRTHAMEFSWKNAGGNTLLARLNLFTGEPNEDDVKKYDINWSSAHKFFGLIANAFLEKLHTGETEYYANPEATQYGAGALSVGFVSQGKAYLYGLNSRAIQHGTQNWLHSTKWFRKDSPHFKFKDFSRYYSFIGTYNPYTLW